MKGRKWKSKRRALCDDALSSLQMVTGCLAHISSNPDMQDEDQLVLSHLAAMLRDSEQKLRGSLKAMG